MLGTIAILGSLGGCSTTRQPMASYDLDHFRVDCKNKEAQIRFLQSQRSTRDDRLLAAVTNAVTPWQMITNPVQYYEREQIRIGRTDWIINQTLREIATQCR